MVSFAVVCASSVAFSNVYGLSVASMFHIVVIGSADCFTTIFSVSIFFSVTVRNSKSL